jgi:16S rRNA (guanine(966)-N(2))-methyltransferase RsmD
MRIYGNRLLKTLSGNDTRPTCSKVRMALFNIWQGKIAHCNWLDLCAGSGAMGAEALCRDAALVVGIDRSPHAGKIIRDNWQKVAKSTQTHRIIIANLPNCLTLLAGETFDRIYFDPPYASDLYQPVLETIVACNLLRSDGEIAVEHNPKLWQAIPISGLEIYREKSYGNTNLTFYQKSKYTNDRTNSNE